MTYDTPPVDEARLVSPAAERNTAVIAAVLEDILPPQGTVLEISSGTGQHAFAFTEAFPDLIWQPSDIDPQSLTSIEAWRALADRENFHRPVDLDVLAWPWPITAADALFCANMIHIAPWRCCEGLFEGAEKLLPATAPLILYGPFKIEGAHTAPSNDAFDRSLKSRHPEWGVRDLEAVADVAGRHRFNLTETIEMPANNKCLVFKKSG